MSLFEQIQTDLKAAMKDRDAQRVGALRMIVSAVQYVAIDAKGELSDEMVIEVLRKEMKKRADSKEMYEQAGRQELAEKEQYEIELIATYIPKLMSEDEVREKVAAIIGKQKFENFGQAMGVVMGQLKGKADGGMVSAVLKELQK